MATEPTEVPVARPPRIPGDPRLPEPRASRRRQPIPEPPQNIILADRILWRNVIAFGALVLMGVATIVIVVLIIVAVFQEYGRYNAIQNAHNQRYVCEIRGDC